jgi:hypothetical protein
VALVSPKTTDILAVRALDGEGLRFFDERSDVSAKRASWYSAATILQRAIALEHDVDSLDIEIASVHRITDPAIGSGAELYLADAHPNGAGLVAWARAEWHDLLRGCVTGKGPASTLGRLFHEELARQGTEPWRGPDLLLKGFRNRAVHGLIDYSLGVEMLATLLDPRYRPGIDRVLPGGSKDALGLTDWAKKAKDLVARFVAAFSRIAEPLQGTNYIHGWRERDRPGTIAVVVHPLWADFPEARNGIAEMAQWASTHGAKRIRLVDSFNLERRMSWVRARRELFKECDLSVTSWATRCIERAACHVPADQRYQPSFGNTLAGEPEADPAGHPSGVRFVHGSYTYERTSDVSLAEVGAGGWLVRFASGELTHVLVRHGADLAAPVRRRAGGTSISPLEAASATVLARRVSDTSAAHKTEAGGE